MAAKRKNLPLAADVQDLIDELMPVPVLTDSDVDPLQLLIDAPADEFQKSLSAPVRKILIASLRNMPAAKSLKEFTSVYSIMEKIEGLNKKDDKGSMPASMVIPLRNVRRNIGSFPEPPFQPPSILELEADMADRALATTTPEPAPAAIEDDEFEI